MTEFWGLVLFAVVVGLVIAALFSLLYCGYVVICKLKKPEPLANSEIPV